MDDLQESLQSASCLPCVTSAGAISGNKIAASSRCLNCSHKECLTETSLPRAHQICREGFSFFRSSWMDQPIAIGGLIHNRLNSKIGGVRRKELSRLLVDEADITGAFQNLQRMQRVLEAARKEAAAETVAFLHDVRSSLGLVLSSCESLIDEYGGGSFGEKLKNADPPLFRLYQAISLLSEQLGLADIISNPESITYGKRSDSDIYQFFHKMVRLFQPRANLRGIKIRLIGNIYEYVELYNSFQLVPLVILDNAVKYANPGSEICIKYDSRADGLYVDFQTEGVPVPDGMAFASG